MAYTQLQRQQHGSGFERGAGPQATMHTSARQRNQNGGKQWANVVSRTRFLLAILLLAWFCVTFIVVPVTEQPF